jgi:recombination associated protein RdgC
MWFRNLQIYRLPKTPPLSAEALEAALAAATLQPCAASSAQSLGWVAPCASGALVHIVNRCWLMALGVEQKLLPAAVVKDAAHERARAIEESQGRRVGRKELRELREAMTQELLPRAFVCRKTIFGWIDPVNGWLVVDAASPATAELFLEHLRKSAETLKVSLLKVEQSPSSAMTGWVAEGDAAAGFTLDQDLELRSAENAAIRYVKHTLEGKEIREHIAEGKIVTRVALTWNDRISFLLDDKLQIKRLAFLDVLKEASDGQAENEDERFDLDFALMSGEVANLLADLVAALGGETAETR